MILLTSFDTWLPSQRSNSSEDLLQALKHRWQTGKSTPPPACTILHRLPVETDRAFAEIMTAIDCHQAQWVVCCGMAESRRDLNLEWQAKKGNQILRTGIDLAALTENLARVRLSEDAGNFVCNALYFELLHYLQSLQATRIHQIPSIQALFVHVPPLLETEQIPEQMPEILHCFEQILTRMSRLE
jgi:pyroglutamyl-peptidase